MRHVPLTLSEDQRLTLNVKIECFSSHHVTYIEKETKLVPYGKNRAEVTYKYKTVFSGLAYIL